MTDRAYLSNIVPRLWPMDKQQAVLAAGVPGWRDVERYQDNVRATARKSHSPDALTERADMLRTTAQSGAGETIYVASLAVLAWSAEDFLTALTGVAARGATVVALDTGRRVTPTAGPAELGEALREFLAARRRDRTGDARQAAALVRAERIKAETAARVALIRDDWNREDEPTTALLLRAGKAPKGQRQVSPMAYRTAALYLGPRRISRRQKTPARKQADTGKDRRNGR